MTLIYCCGCKKSINTRLTSGKEIYPHRQDLAELPFWKCDTCKNYVGCHHKTKNPTKPLGNIATPELKRARREIHKILDPLWQTHPQKYRARGWIYRWLGYELNIKYHTAEIRTIEDARKVYSLVRTIKTADECRVEN